MPPPSKKRKIGSTAPVEITFDPAAREEYLTGFHKRKQARIKHAQEEAAKKEKEERLRLRREMRKRRREDLDKHVREVNQLLKKANGEVSDDGENGNGDESESEFEGFDDAAPEFEPVNREEEYIDEDKYTTVTVESVGISKTGFERAGDESEDEEVEGDEENRDSGGEGGDAGKKKREWTKEKPKSEKSKKKKKKFRYETKAERKMTRMKQGARKRAAATARKGK